MPDREPPIFSPSYESSSSGRYAVGAAPKRSFTSLASLTLLGICMSFGGLILGFMVGDSFGRRNAQYDNPDLREYYAGKCYDYWQTQIKQTLSSSLQQDATERRGQGQKLDEIYSKMSDLERAMTEFTAGRGTQPQAQLPAPSPEKSSVAATKAATPRKL